ncbi:TPA: hypothetical protein I8303_004638 [Aeromonas hydrophila]|nr:hypothetical protein [Aeromonas hydrophila]
MTHQHLPLTIRTFFGHLSRWQSISLQQPIKRFYIPSPQKISGNVPAANHCVYVVNKTLHIFELSRGNIELHGRFPRLLVCNIGGLIHIIRITTIIANAGDIGDIGIAAIRIRLEDAQIARPAKQLQ